MKKGGEEVSKVSNRVFPPFHYEPEMSHKQQFGHRAVPKAPEKIKLNDKEILKIERCGYKNGGNNSECGQPLVIDKS